MDVIVGTAGHIDHGKTALVKALTGIDADRLPEEKRRGITVDIGFAEMTVGEARFGFVDVPGHERFVKNMLAGASGIDLVLLVVAADDGVMPQTREHYEICRLLGVKNGIIAITKSDLVDAETLELARLDIAETTSGGGFLADAPVIAVSSRTGDGIEELRDALESAAAERPDDDLIARLPIDRSFTMRGFGAVVTGTLISGEISEGDELELLPQQRGVRVRSLQSHGRAIRRVHAGQRVAMNLAGVDHTDIERGMIVAEADVLQPTSLLDVEVEMLEGSARPLRSRQRVRLHIGTAEILARARVLDETAEVRAGSRGFVQLSLETPLAAVPGDKFIIRSYSPQTTIGGGTVVHNSPDRHRKREFHSVGSFLTRLATATQEEQLGPLIEHRSEYGVTASDLRARTGLKSEALTAAMDAVIASGSVMRAEGRYISAASFEALSEKVIDAVAHHHKKDPLSRGMPRESLRDEAFSGRPAPIMRAVIDALGCAQKLVTDGDVVRLAGHTSTLSTEEQAVSDKILELLRAAGLEVPKIDEVLASAAQGTALAPPVVNKLLQQHIVSGDVVKVSDEFYFAGRSIRELIERLRSFADASADRLLDVAKFKDIAGVSRKYAIPLLEYFDREKITVRAGEKRLIR